MPFAPQENIYRRVNSILYHRRSAELNKWKHFIWHLVTAVRSLPKYPPGEMLYRGIDGKFFKQEDYSKGSHVVWHSFTSCSKSESQAKSFMKVSLIGKQLNLKLTRIRILEYFSLSKQPKEELLADSLLFLRKRKFFLNQVLSLQFLVQLDLAIIGSSTWSKFQQQIWLFPPPAWSVQVCIAYCYAVFIQLGYKGTGLGTCNAPSLDDESPQPKTTSTTKNPSKLKKLLSIIKSPGTKSGTKSGTKRSSKPIPVKIIVLGCKGKSGFSFLFVSLPNM